jgi:putative spermidine/putrescine transport system permease protein
MMARMLVRILSWLVLGYLMLPLVVIVGSSLTNSAFLSFPPQGITLSWYQKMLADSSYVSAFILSGILAIASTFIAILISVPAAYALARFKFMGNRAISATLLSPLVLPHIVLGAALLQFGSPFGLTRSFLSLLIGHIIIVTPFVLRSTLTLFTPEQQALEEASSDLGARPLTTFFLIILPQIRSGIMTGSIFAFISSFINVELSIFNTTSDLNTIPVKLFNYVQYTIDPTIAAVSGATIGLAVIAIVILDLTVGLDMLSDQK